MPNSQYRASSVTHDRFRDAAEQQMRKPGTSVRRHYDKIGANLVRCGQDALWNVRGKREFRVELMFNPYQFASAIF